MGLRYILLGLLRTPSSGYDLKREFDGTAAFFWHAELSQIYPALKRLEEEGLLESRSEPSERGPDRRVYRTTRRGRRVLREWLVEGPAFGRERLEHVAQMFFLGELDDPGVTRGFLERFRGAMRTRAAAYEEIERRIRDHAPPPERMNADGFHRWATLRLGQRIVDARLDWCEEILGVLEKREAGEAGET